MRSDLELSGGDLDRQSLFANAYLDLPLIPYFDVYLGGGVGVAQVSLQVRAEDSTGLFEPLRFSDEATVFGAQIMVGLRFEFADRVHARAGYRYLAFQDTAVSDDTIGFNSKAGDHVFEVGVGLGF